MSDRRRKLTEQQVEQIRRARDQGQTMGQLAIRYQVDKTVIWRILNGLGYKNVNANLSTTTANT